MDSTRQYLVTGGFGFLSSHLIECLLDNEDNQVHVVDNLSSNPVPIEYLLKELGDRPNLSYSICSVQEYCAQQNIPKLDVIFHLASVVGPAGVLQHAGKIIKLIVDDTYALIEIAVRNRARLVDISTSEVYGGGQEGYCSEGFAKIIPPKTTVRLEYAVAKLAAETAIINTTRVTHLDSVIIRPFNIAGPRQSGRGGFVLPRFIGLAMRNEPLTVFGSGNQIRAFTHVKEIAQGIINAMEFGKSGEAYNLGNPENTTTIDELADLVIKITGSRSEKVYVDPKELYGPLYEEASNKFPDASKAINELHWTPRFSNEQIIKDTFDYMNGIDKRILDMLSGISG